MNETYLCYLALGFCGVNIGVGILVLWRVLYFENQVKCVVGSAIRRLQYLEKKQEEKHEEH